MNQRKAFEASTAGKIHCKLDAVNVVSASMNYAAPKKIEATAVQKPTECEGIDESTLEGKISTPLKFQKCNKRHKLK